MGPWALLFAAALLAPSERVAAQWSGSAGVASDYRYRGVSLSDGRPSAQASVAYDHASGWYGGLAAHQVRLQRSETLGSLLGYVGRALPRTGSVGWEAGVIAIHFERLRRYDYEEAYVGLLAERWSARLYASADYYGQGTKTVYAELDGHLPLASALRLVGHVGTLQRIGGQAPVGEAGWRRDAQLGASFEGRRWELQLLRSMQRGGASPAIYYRGPRRDTWVLSASAFF
jgi:uncharacterized protein (TIGR02001 family)